MISQQRHRKRKVMMRKTQMNIDKSFQVIYKKMTLFSKDALLQKTTMKNQTFNSMLDLGKIQVKKFYLTRKKKKSKMKKHLGRSSKGRKRKRKERRSCKINWKRRKIKRKSLILKRWKSYNCCWQTVIIIRESLDLMLMMRGLRRRFRKIRIILLIQQIKRIKILNSPKAKETNEENMINEINVLI